MGPLPGTAQWSDNFVRRVPTLPGDIIAQVCRETSDSTLDQYDLSLTHVARSQWCAEQRFRKGLPLVSKLWWKPATWALYEHVVIRQVGQLTALARTLSAEDAVIDFGALVRRITLHECVVVLPDYNIAGEDIRTVFERCVALEELSFQRHPDGVDACVESDNRVHPPHACINPIWMFPQIIVPALQARGPTTLRKLDLVSFECDRRNPDLAVALFNLISASPRITALAVQNLEATTGPELPSLEFLEELTLQLPYLAPLLNTRDIWRWDFPRLRSLTVLECYRIPLRVLEHLGRALTYLHMHSDTYNGDPDLARLPVLCPALEHLVLHPSEPLAEWGPALLQTAAAAAAKEPFPKLRFLDVWITSQFDTKQWNAERAASLLEHARSSFAPALEGVRGLLACVPGLLPHTLPTICHPSAMVAAAAAATATATRAGADDSRLVCVRGVWVVQTTWCVRPVADWWLDIDMWPEDDSADYVYESDDGEDEELSDDSDDVT